MRNVKPFSRTGEIRTVGVKMQERGAKLLADLSLEFKLQLASRRTNNLKVEL